MKELLTFLISFLVSFLINMGTDFLNDNKIFIDLITAVSALIFGLWQIRINNRLIKIQDYVAVAVVPKSENENIIKILNTGTVNLYIHGYKIFNTKQIYDKPSLISVGTGDQSYYWIPLPGNLNPNIPQFEILIYLTDEFNNKWLSDNTGILQKRDNNSFGAILRTHKIQKTNWDIDK